MKLYEVPRNTYVKLEEDSRGPPGGESFSEGTIIKFGHIDGMYSFCWDKDKNIVYLPAWLEVSLVKEENNA